MPFIAIDETTGNRIDITMIEKPRTTLQCGKFICQICRQPLFIRAGDKYLTHFYHRTTCHSKTRRECEKETPEHLFGKREMMQMLREQFNGQKVKIEYEFYLEEIDRIADILVIYPMGWRMAHEIQLSNISKEEIEERTNDYESVGIDVVWWLGKKVGIETRDWCKERFGRIFTITISRDDEDHAISLPVFQ
jgi:competence protein CoiA